MALTWTYTLISVLVVSLIPLVGIAVIFGKRKQADIVIVLIGLATGALFGDVFFHLLPEIYNANNSLIRSAWLITAGIFLFFVLEKFLNWHHKHINSHDRHCQGKDCPVIQPLGYVVLIADGFHNFIDGVLIAASYFVSIEIGIATTLAVIFHEIPQEIGDVGVLLHAGFEKMQAIIFNIYSGFTAIAGALLSLVAIGIFINLANILLPIATGGFIYLAGSDLVPELHKTTDFQQSLIQLSAMVVGIAVMYLLLLLG